jgi:hypothetical protein
MKQTETREIDETRDRPPPVHPPLTLPLLLLPGLFREFWQELPYVSRCHEVHHRLIASFHGEKLIDLHMPASVRFPSRGVSHPFPELCLMVCPSEINRPVRPGSLRTGTDGLPPSVLGPDGDGAVFLNEDGDGEVTVPGSHPPSPADNGRLQNIFR